MNARDVMPDLTDTVILYDELAYDDLLPVLWQPLQAPVEPVLAASYDEANLHLLQACAAVDEPLSLIRDKLDDAQPLAAELARLDFKLTLLLDLVAQLASRDLQRPPAVHVRFNALGASFASPEDHQLGSDGVLHVHLRNTLPRPLSFPARVAGRDQNGYTRVRFLSVSDPVADLVEKLTFRRHRRNIAESRRPR